MTVIGNYLKNVKSNYVYFSIETFDAWMDKVNYGMKNKMPRAIDINTIVYQPGHIKPVDILFTQVAMTQNLDLGLK